MNIVAASGGFLSDGRGGLTVGPIFKFAMSLAKNSSRVKICLINTASGDDSIWYLREFAALSRDCSDAQISHLTLFPMPNMSNIREHLLSQDVIWVGGGSVANLLAVWRLHGLDSILYEAWKAGVVLGGVSAGSICWHAGGTTDSFGPDLRPVTNGLAFLPYSNCPHYDSETQRRPVYQKLVADGILPDGWATDDGVGLHFSGTDFVEAISEVFGASAWHVECTNEGVSETRITPRLL